MKIINKFLNLFMRYKYIHYWKFGLQVLSRYICHIHTLYILLRERKILHYKRIYIEIHVLIGIEKGIHNKCHLLLTLISCSVYQTKWSLIFTYDLCVWLSYYNIDYGINWYINSCLIFSGKYGHKKYIYQLNHPFPATIGLPLLSNEW